MSDEDNMKVVDKDGADLTETHEAIPRFRVMSGNKDITSSITWGIVVVLLLVVLVALMMMLLVKGGVEEGKSISAPATTLPAPSIPQNQQPYIKIDNINIQYSGQDSATGSGKDADALCKAFEDKIAQKLAEEKNG